MYQRSISAVKSFDKIGSSKKEAAPRFWPWNPSEILSSSSQCNAANLAGDEQVTPNRRSDQPHCGSGQHDHQELTVFDSYLAVQRQWERRQKKECRTGAEYETNTGP